MAEDALEAGKVPAAPEVVHREGMPEGVGREPNAGDASSRPECL